MAHNNFYILEKLLLLLDDPRNDIYIHIDKKISDFNFGYFQNLCKASKVRYPQKRINVRWGTQSLVITELLLYKTAVAYESYQYYHLLSGVDLPLKSQHEIHQLQQRYLWLVTHSVGVTILFYRLKLDILLERFELICQKVKRLFLRRFAVFKRVDYETEKEKRFNP